MESAEGSEVEWISSQANPAENTKLANTILAYLSSRSAHSAVKQSTNNEQQTTNYELCAILSYPAQFNKMLKYKSGKFFANL